MVLYLSLLLRTSQVSSEADVSGLCVWRGERGGQSPAARVLWYSGLGVLWSLLSQPEQEVLGEWWGAGCLLSTGRDHETSVDQHQLRWGDHAWSRDVSQCWDSWCSWQHDPGQTLWSSHSSCSGHCSTLIIIVQSPVPADQAVGVTVSSARSHLEIILIQSWQHLHCPLCWTQVFSN